MSGKGERKEDRQVTDFAWRIHATQESWTEKADFKAGLLLPAQFGILTILGAILLSDRRPHLSSLSRLIITLGIGVISIAVVLAALVVIPRLVSVDPEKNDVIYFGHLRLMNAKSIQTQIEQMNNEDQVGAVSKQLYIMSKINWKKHCLLRFGIILTLIGTAFCVLPLLLAGLDI